MPSIISLIFCTACTLVAAEVDVVDEAGCRIERFTVTSPEMGRDIAAVVVLPPARLADPAKPLPVLYALHGRKATYTTWSAMMPLKRALAETPMIVASFSADETSWYLDATQRPDSRFTTFFHETFIPTVESAYAGDGRRAITGFSMGGFGALHLALAAPDRFTSISALSGAFTPTASERTSGDLVALLGERADHEADYAAIDLETRLRTRFAQLPPLYFHCGSEDRLVTSQRHLGTVLRDLGLGEDRLVLSETPGGHDWAFWRDASAGVIAFHGRHFATQP